MINEAHPAFHLWNALDSDLARRGLHGWTLVVAPDPASIFAVASLAPMFRHVHGKVHDQINLVVQAGMADVLELFASYISNTLVHPNLTPGLLDAIGGIGLFRPGSPYLADLRRHGDGRISSFLGHAGVEALDLWRYVLHLPWGAEAAPPTVPTERLEQAAERFTVLGLPAGRTAVMLRGEAAGWPETHWQAAARQLEVAGFTPCAVARPGLAPVAGTVGAEINGAELIPFCTRAGLVITADTGWTDIVLHAGCRRVVLHPDLDSLRKHTPAPASAPPPSDLLLPVRLEADEFAVRVAAAAGGAAP